MCVGVGVGVHKCVSKHVAPLNRWQVSAWITTNMDYDKHGLRQTMH
jgi:hypothetical protein